MTVDTAVPNRDPVDQLRRHLDALTMATEYAEQVCRTAIVPDHLRGRTADCAVTILLGAELGLTPLQSLQNIYTKYGQPAVYARTMQAILETYGYRFEKVLDTDEAVTVKLTAPDGRTEENTWDWARAEKAGYTPRLDDDAGDWARSEDGQVIGNEKYVTDPRAMYWAKAVSVLSRHLAPHLLLGMPYTREDLESEPAPVTTAARVVRAAPIADAAAGDEGGGQAVVQDWTPPASDDERQEDADAVAPSEEQDTVPADPEEPASAAQQERVLELLDDEGYRTPARKRGYLSKRFEREISSAQHLTTSEASVLILSLSGSTSGEEGPR